MSPPIMLFTPVEVKAIIIKLNTRKATGYDLLSGLILKQLSYRPFDNNFQLHPKLIFPQYGNMLKL